MCINMYPISLPDLRLTDIAMIKVVTALWKHSDIKEQLKIYAGAGSFSGKFSPEMKKQLHEKICNKIDLLTSLPTPQKHILKLVSKEVSISAFTWLQRYQTEVLEQLDDFIDNLQWDHFGNIDGTETYRSVYFKGRQSKTFRFYRMLHNLCLEDCLNGFWTKNREWATKTHSIMSNRQTKLLFEYWKDKTDSATHIPGRDIVLQKTILAILIKKLHHGLYTDFEYFWSKLNSRNKKTYIAKFSISLQSHFKLFSDFNFVTGFFGLTKAVRHINFLAKFVTDNNLPTLSHLSFNPIFELNVGVLLHWTWLHSFTDKFEEMCDDIGAAEFNTVIKVINSKSQREYEISGDTQKYHDLTRDIWKKSPGLLKLAVSHCQDFWKNILNIVLVKDVELIRLILNDENLADGRRQLLNPGTWEFYTSWALTEDLHLAEKFAQLVLQSEAERQWFELNIVKF